MTALRLTDAGVSAMVDGDNTGTRAVRITKLALGDGSGPGGAGDDERTTLRNQRDIEAVFGSPPVAGQMAVTAALNTPGAYAATEMGLFAQIEGGAEFLFAYWTDAGTVFINKPADLRTLVAATIAIRRSAAQLQVTIDPRLTVGTVGAFDDLSDTPPSKVNAARHKVAVSADGRSLVYATTLAAHEVANDAQSRAGILRTVAVPPAGLRAVISDLIDGAPDNRNTLRDLSDAINAVLARVPDNDDIDTRITRAAAAGFPGYATEAYVVRRLPLFLGRFATSVGHTAFAEDTLPASVKLSWPAATFLNIRLVGRVGLPGSDIALFRVENTIVSVERLQRGPLRIALGAFVATLRLTPPATLTLENSSVGARPDQAADISVYNAPSIEFYTA